MSFERFLIDCVVVLAAAKLGGEAAERLKQPAVLGELVAGMLVGMSVLGAAGGLPVVGPFLAHCALNPDAPLLATLANIGAVLLLFEAGLDSDMAELQRLGFAALWVACVGVAIPFALGFVTAHQIGLSTPSSIYLGAALTATSVGITARTFADLRMSERTEAKVVLGAAVADDVLGLIILALVSGLVGGGAAAGAAVAPHRSLFVVISAALLFLVGSLVIGIYAAPWILRLAAKMKTRASLSSAALALCFLFAAAAQVVGGLAPIVGAFAAGLVLARTEHKLHLEEKIKPVADLFIPFFFILMGAAMPIREINPATPDGRQTLLIAFVLLIVGVIGKVIAGLTLPTRGISRWIVGIGMIPRGEVGLIFASVGLAKGLINGSLFTAIVLMVMFTTFLTPPLLQLATRLLRTFPGTETVEGEVAVPIIPAS